MNGGLNRSARVRSRPWVLVRLPPPAGGVEGVTSSVPCVGGVDGSPAVGVAVAEGELVGVGVSVGDGEEGPPVCGAGGGCVLGSEAARCFEHAANVMAVSEERVRAVRRLTGLSTYFIRTSYV